MFVVRVETQWNIDVGWLAICAHTLRKVQDHSGDVYVVPFIEDQRSGGLIQPEGT